jgi:hypothetical protein
MIFNNLLSQPVCHPLPNVKVVIHNPFLAYTTHLPGPVTGRDDWMFDGEHEQARGAQGLEDMLEDVVHVFDIVER